MFDVTNPIAFHIHGGGGGIASSVGELLVFIESLTSMQAPDILAALLPGVAVMGNIHPLFVHFPIVFLLAFFVLDVVASLAKKDAWRYVAGWLLYMGAASTLVTVATGLNAAASVPHGENVHAIMEHHQNFGLIVLSLTLLLSVWRWLGWNSLQRTGNVFYLAVAAVMVVCMTLSADLGGLMVYHYGINVGTEPLPANSFPHEHEHAHEHEHSH